VCVYPTKPRADGHHLDTFHGVRNTGKPFFKVGAKEPEYEGVTNSKSSTVS